MSGPCPFTPRPVPGTPKRPLPLAGCRARIPSATLSDHLADHDDPHRTRDLVPAVRFGDGLPSILPSDKATDFYVDTSTKELYVMVVSDGALRWTLVSRVAGIDYDGLENKPTLNGRTLQGAVELTGEDLKTGADPEAPTIADRIDGKQDELSDDQKGVLDGGPYLPATPSEQVDGSFDVPPGTLQNISASSGEFGDSLSRGGHEVAIEDQLRVTMQLVGSDPYTVQLDGVTQTFAEIKTYAQTRNAVIQRGQGTYRVTYIGANEMMWDVTGTVQGEVKTGQIHIFDQNGATVVQRVEPKTLATKTMLDSKADKISDTVVAKIDEERHDDNIVVRIMRVPIEFARKAFNAVRMSFHQDDRDEASFMAIGYSTGNGGTSGVTYDDIVVELSSDYFFKNESGSHIYNFSQNVTSKIPSEAKFLTFFFFDDSEMEYSGTAPIETGYATTEEEQQKKYQIQTQNAGFFYTDHAPLMDFLVVNDPVARKSSVDSVTAKVDDIKSTVSTNNRFLVGGSYSEPPAEGSPTTAAIQTHDAGTDKWTDEIRIDKAYDAVTGGSAMVKLDKSVQNITVASTSLTIVLPEETRGTVRDLCLYVNNNSGADCALAFPAGTYYGDNPNGAVAKNGGVTAVYITEMPVGSWMLRIVELGQFKVRATA